jgi:type VII secretion integral membrane protein EccD
VVLTSYSRVTVVSGTRRVDLALPSALPLADVVPQVLRFCAPEESAGAPVEFTLAKLGGQPLALSQSLGEAGVHDGDVIELRAFDAPTRPAFVEDVRDAIEDAIDRAGGAWNTRATITFAVGAASALLLLLLIEPVAQAVAAVVAGGPIVPWDVPRSLSSLTSALVLVGATWVASRAGAGWVAYLSSIAAGLWAMTGAAELVLDQDGSLAAALSVGLGAAVLAAGLMRGFTSRATPLLAAAGVPLGASVVVLVGTTLGAESGVMVRVVALVAVLSVGVMPRVSIAVGGLSSADYRIRNAGRMTDQALARRLQESGGLLIGALYGVALVVTSVGFWLALRPEAWGHDLWDGLLGVSLAAAMLLRSRVFSRVADMLPLRVSALLILLGTVLQLAGDYDVLGTWLTAAIAGVAAIALGVSLLRLSEVTRARIKRALNVVEFIVIVDLFVVTMGAVTLYDWLRDR